ncbi:hypothetical protein PanWU01x14_099780 [Parasponia andersonii]|uniref:Uncharacterized protein n=1 Tax=Parasponia andersonii TaxID=3476 RepID=A0A2P5D3D6_PARAD|nr:hypothetical protein PanWU01x14_099780 [Parasponia andersonii]
MFRNCLANSARFLWNSVAGRHGALDVLFIDVGVQPPTSINSTSSAPCLPVFSATCQFWCHGFRNSRKFVRIPAHVHHVRYTLPCFVTILPTLQQFLWNSVVGVQPPTLINSTSSAPCLPVFSPTCQGWCHGFCNSRKIVRILA